MRDLVAKGIDEEDTQDRKRWKQKLKDVFVLKETSTLRKLITKNKRLSLCVLM